MSSDASSSLASSREEDTSSLSDLGGPGGVNAVTAFIRLVKRSVFGSLFVASKQVHGNSFRTLLGACVRFLQMLAFILSPHAHFAINTDTMYPLSRVSSAFTIGGWIDYMPASVFIILFYAALGIAAVLVVGMAWAAVCFARNKFPVLWPLKLVAKIGTFCATVLYIPVLSLLMSSFSCHEKAVSRLWSEAGIACWGGAFVGQAAVVGALTVAFIATCSLFTLVFYDWNPISTNLAARVHGRVEFGFLLLKTLLVVLCETFPTSINVWFLQALIVISGLVWVLMYTISLPFINHHMNMLSVAFGCAHLFAGLCMILAQAIPGYDAGIMLYFGCPIAGLLGAFLVQKRLVRLAFCPVTLLRSPYEVDLKVRLILNRFLYGNPLGRGWPAHFVPPRDIREVIGDKAISRNVVNDVAANSGAGLGHGMPDPPRGKGGARRIAFAGGAAGSASDSGGAVSGRREGSVLGKGTARRPDVGYNSAADSSDVDGSAVGSKLKAAAASHLDKMAGRSGGAGAGKGGAAAKAGASGSITYDTESLRILAAALDTEDDLELRGRFVQRLLPREAVDLMEEIFQAGATRFRNSSLLHLLWARFYSVFRPNTHLELSHMMQSQRYDAPLDVEYFIFQASKKCEDSSGTKTAGSLSALSRVSFEKHFQDAKRFVQRAMHRQVSYWSEAMEQAPDLNKLRRIAADLTRAMANAEGAFRSLMGINPQSIAAIRLISQYQMYVNCDNEKAQTLLLEADRLEEQQAKEAKEEGGAALRLMQEVGHADSDNMAIISVAATPDQLGVIRSVNAHACKLFGWSRWQMERRNVTMIIPEPFSLIHENALLNYLQSGESQVVDHTRVLVGQHQAGHIFPLLLSVRETSLAENVPPSFVAMIRPLITEEQMLLMDADFTVRAGTLASLDAMGVTAADLHANQFSIAEWIPNFSDILPDLLSGRQMDCVLDRSNMTSYFNANHNHRALGDGSATAGADSSEEAGGAAGPHKGLAASRGASFKAGSAMAFAAASSGPVTPMRCELQVVPVLKGAQNVYCLFWSKVAPKPGLASLSSALGSPGFAPSRPGVAHTPAGSSAASVNEDAASRHRTPATPKSPGYSAPASGAPSRRASQQQQELVPPAALPRNHPPVTPGASGGKCPVNLRVPPGATAGSITVTDEERVRYTGAPAPTTNAAGRPSALKSKSKTVIPVAPLPAAIDTTVADEEAAATTPAMTPASSGGRGFGHLTGISPRAYTHHGKTPGSKTAEDDDATSTGSAKRSEGDDASLPLPFSPEALGLPAGGVMLGDADVSLAATTSVELVKTTGPEGYADPAKRVRVTGSMPVMTTSLYPTLASASASSVGAGALTDTGRSGGLVSGGWPSGRDNASLIDTASCVSDAQVGSVGSGLGSGGGGGRRRTALPGGGAGGDVGGGGSSRTSGANRVLNRLRKVVNARNQPLLRSLVCLRNAGLAGMLVAVTVAVAFVVTLYTSFDEYRSNLVASSKSADLSVWSSQMLYYARTLGLMAAKWDLSSNTTRDTIRADLASVANNFLEYHRSLHLIAHDSDVVDYGVYTDPIYNITLFDPSPTGGVSTPRPMQESLLEVGNQMGAVMLEIATRPFEEITPNIPAFAFMTANFFQGQPGEVALHELVFDWYNGCLIREKKFRFDGQVVFASVIAIIGLLMACILLPTLIYVDRSSDDVTHQILRLPRGHLSKLRERAVARYRKLLTTESDEDDSDAASRVEEDPDDDDFFDTEKAVEDARKALADAVNGVAVGPSKAARRVSWNATTSEGAIIKEAETKKATPPPAPARRCCNSCRRAPPIMVTTKDGRRVRKNAPRKRMDSLFRLMCRFIFPFVTVLVYFSVLYTTSMAALDRSLITGSMAILASDRVVVMTQFATNVRRVLGSFGGNGFPIFDGMVAITEELAQEVTNIHRFLNYGDGLSDPHFIPASLRESRLEDLFTGGMLTESRELLHGDVCMRLLEPLVPHEDVTGREANLNLDVNECHGLGTGALGRGIVDVFPDLLARGRALVKNRQKSWLPLNSTDGVGWTLGADGVTRTGRFSVPDELVSRPFETFRMMFEKYASTALLRLARSYSDSAVATIEDQQSFAVAFTAAFVVSFLCYGLWTFLHQVRVLNHDIQRQRTMLLLIPGQVVKQTPDLKRLIEKLSSQEQMLALSK